MPVTSKATKLAAPLAVLLRSPMGCVLVPREPTKATADGYTVHELGRVLVSSIPKENLT